jgi:hypothetical protein
MINSKSTMSQISFFFALKKRNILRISNDFKAIYIENIYKQNFNKWKFLFLQNVKLFLK